MLPSENVSRYILTVCDRPRYVFNELCYSSFVNLALAFLEFIFWWAWVKGYTEA